LPDGEAQIIGKHDGAPLPTQDARFPPEFGRERGGRNDDTAVPRRRNLFRSASWVSKIAIVVSAGGQGAQFNGFWFVSQTTKPGELQYIRWAFVGFLDKDTMRMTELGASAHPL
jgi:hypothetical protein